MKLYIAWERCWNGQLIVTDVQGQVHYRFEEKLWSLLTLRRKLRVFDRNQREVAFIQQKWVLMKGKYYVYREGRLAAVIREKWSWGEKYTIEQMGWTITGSKLPYEYVISKADTPLVRVTKGKLDSAMRFELDFLEEADELIACIAVIVIDYMANDEHP
ncbi:MAG: hypothetical protein IJA83_04770 [Clostridia bacterium]|nr:hypothetical protein [Clostridia bacterium]